MKKELPKPSDHICLWILSSLLVIYLSIMHHPYSGLVNVDLNKSYYPTGESPSVVFFIIVSIFLGFCISTQILQRTGCFYKNK
jgi:hypothetical protein